MQIWAVLVGRSFFFWSFQCCDRADSFPIKFNCTQLRRPALFHFFSIFTGQRQHIIFLPQESFPYLHIFPLCSQVPLLVRFVPPWPSFFFFQIFWSRSSHELTLILFLLVFFFLASPRNHPQSAHCRLLLVRMCLAPPLSLPCVLSAFFLRLGLFFF